MVKEGNLHGIQLSCYTKSNKSGEQFIKDHGIAYIISGELEAYDGQETHIYRSGEVVLFRKNTLIRFVKYPEKDGEFQAISVNLEESFLQDFASHYGIHAQHPPKGSLFKMDRDPLITHYFTGLLAWFGQQVSPELMDIKKSEIIHLLLRHDEQLKDIMFHFAIPGKINLEAFMNKHFRFNTPLTQLAFLTGRSLASFKRDFEKIFSTSPSRWLQQKRLEEAYYLLNTKNWKPKDVYLEVGFETLSHFSYAFKNKFGVNPSNV